MSGTKRPLHKLECQVEPQSQLLREAAPAMDVLSILSNVSSAHEAVSLSATLLELRAFIDNDLAEVEAGLAGIANSPHAASDLVDKPVHLSARHLLSLADKRLRP